MVVKVWVDAQPRNGTQRVPKYPSSVMSVFLKLTQIQAVTGWSLQRPNSILQNDHTWGLVKCAETEINCLYQLLFWQTSNQNAWYSSKDVAATSQDHCTLSISLIHWLKQSHWTLLHHSATLFRVPMACSFSCTLTALHWNGSRLCCSSGQLLSLPTDGAC